MLNAVQAGHDLKQPGFICAAVGEVAADGCSDFILMLRHQLIQGLQMLPALFKARIALRLERLLLLLKSLLILLVTSSCLGNNNNKAMIE
mgnify:CR=1 FL=1